MSEDRDRDPVRGRSDVPSPSRIDKGDDAELPPQLTTSVPPDDRVPDTGVDKGEKPAFTPDARRERDG